MNRRTFLCGLTLGTLSAPLATGAQEPMKGPRIGFLGAESPSTSRHFLEAFRQGLRDLGYVEGQNFTLEERWGEGRNERFPELVAELVQLKANVIVALSVPAALAAKKGTRTIPIVFVAGEAFSAGLITNLARPGENVTGVSLALGQELSGKLLQLLQEAAGNKISRVAALWDPGTASNVGYLKDLQVAAQQLKVKLLPEGVREPSQLDRAFAAMAAARAQALVVFTSPLTVRFRGRIVDLAAKSRLPAMYGFREFAVDGGLMAYGPNVPDACRRAATYVDKILKGAKPGDLPVEQPTKFELVINLKTAKTLGLTIPPLLLSRADQVIE